MIYEPQEWINRSTDTPVSAERLTYIEEGLRDASSMAFGVQQATPRYLFPDDNQTLQVQTLIGETVKKVVKDQPYREPTDDEFNESLVAFLAASMLNGRTLGLATIFYGYDTDAFANIGGIRFDRDPEACWGLYARTAGNSHIHTIIEAPHPVFDEGTDQIAWKAFQAAAAAKIPGVMLAVAGSHRGDVSGDNPRDVAHQTGSFFHRFIANFVTYSRARQIQIHGYADASAPDFDVIVSAGAGAPSASVKAYADSLEANGLRVGRSWDGSATVLTGTKNKLGLLAAGLGAEFLHIEVNASSRSNEAIWGELFRVGLLDVNLPGTILADSYPKPIGSANAKGSSEYAARADHTHRLVQNDAVDGEYVKRKDGGWRSVPATEIATDLGVDNALQDVANATYSATGGTLMKRTSTGAVSVADATAGVHAMNKRSVESMLKAFADANSLTWPIPEGDS